MKLISAIILTLSFTTCELLASDQLVVVVAAHNPLQRLSRDGAAALYLGLANSADSKSRIIPLDQANSEVRKLFYQRLLGRSSNQMLSYWSKKALSGEASPPRQIDEQQIESALRDNPNAIIYVSADNIPANVRVIFRLPAET